MNPLSRNVFNAARSSAAMQLRCKSSAAAVLKADSSKFTIQTFNAISPIGLARFEQSKYKIVKGEDLPADPEEDSHAILLRSYKLQKHEVQKGVASIARCGSGTNNIPVTDMTKRGVVVFNTPGANANAVKELVLCGLFLSARNIVGGINHVKKLFEDEKDNAVIKKRIESEKKHFAGCELAGKTLGIVGLGHIGALVAEAAIRLGMNVVGYDPALSVDAAWKIPSEVRRSSSIQQLMAVSDFVTLHVPYMPATHKILSKDMLSCMKPHTSILNFARQELIDSEALKEMFDAGTHHGNYVADFPDDVLQKYPNVILMPHLGASTEEAEINSATMAANQVKDFMETGTIRNSVNFPTTVLEPRASDVAARLCIVNSNTPGMLGSITTAVGELGVNIVQQINTSRGEIAYNVIDMETIPGSPEKFLDNFNRFSGILNARLILGANSTFFQTYHNEK